MQAKSKLFKLCLLWLLTLLALGRPNGLVRAQSATDEPAALSLAALSNATYRSAYAEEGEVTLENGSYVVAAGASAEERVTLTGYVAYGDLTGDDIADAAAILETNTAGTAVFYELAVMVAEESQPVNVATTLIGDRVALQDLRIVAGQIIVDLTTHGAGDADCCPAHEQRVTYTLVNDQLSQVGEEVIVVAEPAGVFRPDTDPTVATLTLGGPNAFWLDPTLVSLHSGASTGPRVEASRLGRGCVGAINERPEVVLHWTAEERVEKLHLFFLSMGDPTMLVVTPAGDVLCNDDLNPLVLDPKLTIAKPAPGRYAIYLGSFADKTTTPGFLVVTSLNLSPATLDIEQLFPRKIHPGAVGEPKPIDVLQVDAPVAATSAISLTQATTPVTSTVVAGGELGAYEIELGNDLCTGFITAASTYRFDWQGEDQQLVLFFEGEADTTLVVRDPQGLFQCNDDADGARNLNPYLALTPIAGDYNVWVGSFAPKTPVTGTLTLATTKDRQPAPLQSSE
jgi:hypothetical protein